MRQRMLAASYPIYLVATLGILYLVVILVQLPGASRRGDFSIYYACAVAMHRGLDPYAIDMREFTRGLGFEPDPFIHPADTPTFTLGTMPFAMMAPATAYAIWLCASVLCLFASMYLLFGGMDLPGAILMSLATLGFTPLADNFRWAQSQVFVVFGILTFFRLLRRGSDGAAGTTLALLGLLRGYPLVLGGYLIALRRWRAIISLAIAFVAGALATVAMIGIGPWANFLRVLGVIGGHQWFTLDPRWEVSAANVSLDAFTARPLTLVAGPHLPRGLMLFRGAIVIALKLGILGASFRATISTSDDRDGRALSLWIVTMLLLTPVVWLHYLTLLIVPLGLIAAPSRRERLTLQPAKLTYCAIVLATPVMSTLTFHADIFTWPATALAEWGFLALLSAWFAAYRFVTEASRPELLADQLPIAQHS